MAIDMPVYLEMRRKFLVNRAAFPVQELAKHAGHWVAWSPDGSRIAASAADPDMLDTLLQAAGEDPAKCVIEGIPDDARTSGFLNASTSAPTPAGDLRSMY